MFAFLGSIPLGISPFTGPTAASEKEKSTFARLAVAEGKPVLQDRGDELSTKSLAFFFDATFCDPETEIANLREARLSRVPMPWTPGDGSFTGGRYVVEEINVKLKKTTLSGRIVRLEADLTLIEAPVQSLQALEQTLARAGAAALSGAAALNVGAKS